MTTRLCRQAPSAAGADGVRPHPADQPSGARGCGESQARVAAKLCCIRVGSRGSRLALTQAERAAERCARTG